MAGFRAGEHFMHLLQAVYPTVRHMSRVTRHALQVTRHPRVALLRVRCNKVDASIGKNKRKAALNEIVSRVLAEHVGGLTKANFLHFSKGNRRHTFVKASQHCNVIINLFNK